VEAGPVVLSLDGRHELLLADQLLAQEQPGQGLLRLPPGC